MRVDGFFVVGRETSGDTVFLETYMDGDMPVEHWGDLRFADRYLLFKDAKKAADNAPRTYESDEPATVWRFEATVTKET